MLTAIGTACWSLSWRSRYLLAGDARAWCAASYDRIDNPRHLAFVCVMDLAFGTNHCAYSWAWWGCYVGSAPDRLEDVTPDDENEPVGLRPC